jgi:DNA helicase-2/ATP-dependent DNA helicase PcrA
LAAAPGRARGPDRKVARQLFYFLAGRIDEKALTAAWETAKLGIGKRSLAAAVANASKARDDIGKADMGRFQVHNLQRQFVAFLETAALREEQVPDGRGEVVFYNLGKFSQAISDFESIHFHSKPVHKYASFAKFLEYQAEHAYPEGWQDSRTPLRRARATQDGKIDRRASPPCHAA